MREMNCESLVRRADHRMDGRKSTYDLRIIMRDVNIYVHKSCVLCYIFVGRPRLCRKLNEITAGNCSSVGFADSVAYDKTKAGLDCS